MDLKQNINKVHGDLLNNFNDVKIVEKSSLEMNNYFELSVLENNKELKLIIRKNDIENNIFNWKYYSNPLNIDSYLIERVSSIGNFYNDVKDILEKNRFDEDYLNKVNEDMDIKEDDLIGLKVNNVYTKGIEFVLVFDDREIGICCSGGETVDVYGNTDIENDIISNVVIKEYEIEIDFENGKRLEIGDPTGGEGLEIYKK